MQSSRYANIKLAQALWPMWMSISYVLFVLVVGLDSLTLQVCSFQDVPLACLLLMQWWLLCRTNSTSEHNHVNHQDEPSSMASNIIDTITDAMPSRDALQQAHPGVAAAADLLLGQASNTKTADDADAKLSPQPDKDAGKEAGPSGEGKVTVGEIPWRQVAGLLHSQGITDPQGLVSPPPDHPHMQI